VSRRAVFHDQAVVELNEAAAYDARTRAGLGLAFLAAVQQSVGAMTVTPYGGRPVEAEIRCWVVRRFPYSIFYSVREDELRILAIGHQKRRPYYWEADPDVGDTLSNGPRLTPEA
jgi:plasmid stabilization system protein ParE